MELKEPTSKPFRFEGPRQKRIYEKLQRLVGLGPAVFYRDACRLMMDDLPYETTTHLVSHLLREIESALQDVLETVAERTERLTKKSRSDNEGHKAKILSILKGLKIPETDPVAQAWLKLPGRKNNYGLYARAHRHALLPPRRVDEDFRKFWEEINSILDVVLGRFEAHYLTIIGVLDKLLANPTPTEEDVKRFQNHVPNNQVAFGYFFDRLTNSAWLELLKSEGFFKQPPEPIRDDEKGTVSFPIWSECRYLVRMAKVVGVQQIVQEILIHIPDTENPFVHQDLAEIALALPAPMAAEWAKKEVKWIERQNRLDFLLPDKIGKLVGHLAQGGQVEAALDLARSLLVVLPDPRQEEQEGREELDLFSPKPKTLFKEWEYERILKRDIPSLVEAARENALNLLCDLLEKTILYSRRRVEAEGEEPEDYSYIWRKAIESDGQNRIGGLRNLLISAVRNAAEQVAKADPLQIRTLVEGLERHRWPTFRRIALHLLRRFPETVGNLIAERLTDRKQFGKFRHEYSLLLKEQFANLDKEDQEKILAWIDEGPDLEAFKDGREKWDGQRPLQEAAEKYGRHWRKERLTILVESLPQAWKERYDQLVVEFGESEQPDDDSAVWVGYVSPKLEDDFRTMSVQEIVEYLNIWQPPGGDKWRSPSLEGLGQELRKAGSSDIFTGIGR